MAHAILIGDQQAFERVRIRLEMLGLTVCEASAPVATSVGDCDLVVHVASARQSDVPPRPSGELPAAPLLCLGAPRPGAWSVVDRDDLEGPAFVDAVRACVDRAWQLRRRPAPVPPAVRYRSLLAHELRSPLAVVATSLRALAETPPGAAGAGDRELVARALRNVERLARTVDWNERHLALADAAPVPARRVLGLGELGDTLSELASTAVRDGAEDVVLETDPELVAAVVTQLIRACECLAPTAAPQLELLRAGADAAVRISVPVLDERAPRVARIGLSRPDDDHGRDELVELASLLVPGAALESLGARLVPDPDDGGVLDLRLPSAAVPAGI